MASPDDSQFEPQGHGGDEPRSSLHADTPPPPMDGYASPAAAPPVPRPAEDPVWSGWDVLLIAALTFVIVMLLQFALAKAAQLLWYPRLPLLDAAQKVGQKPILLIILQFVLYLPVFLLMIALVEGKYHVPFWQSIRWNWPRSTWKLLALGAVLLLTLTTLESLLPMPKDTPFERLFDRPLDAYLLAILATTLGPLMEELFFHGLMYPVLAREIGVAWGVLLSALLFALLHLPQYGWAWAAGLVIFLVGIVCGIVRATTGSVAASFLVHAGYNGTQMLIALAFTHGFTRMPKSLLECFSG